MAPAQTTREVHPLLGLWAVLIAAALTFAGARINQVVIERLSETAGQPASQPQTPSPDTRITADA